MVNIGIIGCGQWGTNHIRIFYFSKRAKVKLCCDKDKARLNALRKTYSGLATTQDYADLLRDDTIDAIVVATPTATHYQLAKAALLNGKHVLCEKPLAIKKQETEELMRLALRNKRVLMVGYVFLFNEGIITLKDYIKKKRLGKILYMHFTRTNLGPIRDDVDVVYDLASHDISIASFLLERWPMSVSANIGSFLRRGISDIAFVTLYYPDNVLVNTHTSWLDPVKTRHLTCIGDRKMAIWNDLDAQEPVRIFDKGVTREPFYSDYGEFQLLPREGGVTSPLVKLVEPLKRQDNQFLDCISRGKRPLTDGLFGHRVTGVLEAIQSSIRDRGRIQRIR